MNKMLILAATAAAALAGTAAGAKPLTAVPPKLDPTKAYVLIEYRLLANPYASFPGSRKTMRLNAGLTLARYDPALGDVRGLGKAKANPVPPGQVATELFRNKPIAKGADSRLFLLEVDPDLWVVQGFAATSFSLGSYSFRLEPGTIVDLGVVTAENDWAEGQRQAKTGDILKMAFIGPFAKHPDMAPMRLSFRPRAASDMPVPAGLPADKLVPAAFTPDQKFGNYLGGLVNRIEGVNARARAAPAAPAPDEAAPKP
ncbi:MAG TPA: hypothetical protein VGC56_14820 [Allosphingosinicella sp.]|jgi:hypothetical protein